MSIKRLIVITLISLLPFVGGYTSVRAEEKATTCIQVSQYSGGVGIVCGAHTPVETGLADINPLVLASIFFIFAGYGMYSYRKLQKSEISLN